MADNDPETDVWTDVLGYTDLSETLFTTELKEEAAEIITNLGDNHPEIFHEYELTPEEYNRVFRLAIASVDGTVKQQGGTNTEERVINDFLAPAQANGYVDYTKGSYQQIDYEGELLPTSEQFSMDTKGGEGNSENNFDAPNSTDRVIIWSELTVGNDQEPSRRIGSVISRIVKEALDEDQHSVSYIVIRDHVAGPGTEHTSEADPYPDIVILPEELPMEPGEGKRAEVTNENEEFVRMVYDTLFGITDIHRETVEKRLWLHDLVWRDTDNSRPVQKRLYNKHDPTIEITTRPIARYRSATD